MTPNKIPKTIHILWIGPHDPPLECIESWRKKHPKWNHIFWDETKLSEFDFQNKHAIKMSKTISGQVNVMRYEILKHYGGVFVDADALCLKSLDKGDFRQNEAFSCYVNENYSQRIANGYMGCVKNYPLLDELIERISKIPDSIFEAEENRSWMITGPEMVRKAIEETQDKIRIYPSVTFCPVHHSAVRAQNWKEADIFALQYWNSTHRGINSASTRAKLDSALDEFHSEYFEFKKMQSIKKYSIISAISISFLLGIFILMNN